jgi:hypothetical protein
MATPFSGATLQRQVPDVTEESGKTWVLRPIALDAVSLAGDHHSAKAQ